MGVKLKAQITNVGEELFSMLLGMDLFFSQSPQQYIKNMGLPSEEEVVGAMLLAGYLTGSSDSWKINPEIKKAVFRRLSKTLKIGPSSPLEPSELPVPLHTLVRHFKMRIPAKGSAIPKDLFLRFRRLCKKYDSKDIDQQMVKFFKLAMQNNDFSFESFEKYLADCARFFLISQIRSNR